MTKREKIEYLLNLKEFSNDDVELAKELLSKYLKTIKNNSTYFQRHPEYYQKFKENQKKKYDYLYHNDPEFRDKEIKRYREVHKRRQANGYYENKRKNDKK